MIDADRLGKLDVGIKHMVALACVQLIKGPRLLTISCCSSQIGARMSLVQSIFVKGCQNTEFRTISE